MPEQSDTPATPAPAPRFPAPGTGSPEPADRFYREEVALALRNRGMPLEAMRYPITPAGLHYLLIHFDVPPYDAPVTDAPATDTFAADAQDEDAPAADTLVADAPAANAPGNNASARPWRLEIAGLVNRPLSLSLPQLMARPAVTTAVTMECAGNGRALLSPRPLSQPWMHEAIGTAHWTGTPLAPLLAAAGLRPEARELIFTGRDEGIQGDERQHYQRSLTIPQATADEVLLAWAMNGAPLPPQHGCPLRLVVPGWYGMTSVKWLERIDAVAGHFDGYQMERTYRYSQTPADPGDPVTTIRVRALMIPPGIPDFMTRRRLVDAGQHLITGRAWAGPDQVTRVEFSGDGGATWQDARLAAPVGQWAWRAWQCPWTARPGQWTLLARATDSRGNTQPTTQFWTQQGMGNNMAQRVAVLVA